MLALTLLEPGGDAMKVLLPEPRGFNRTAGRLLSGAGLLALFALVRAVLPEAPAHADTTPCNWELSTVPRAIPISPDGSLAYSVRIVSTGGPVVNSSIRIVFSTVGDSLICWCNGSPWVPGSPHVFTASTNASGVATFHIAAGGCVENQLASIPGDKNYAAEVFADLCKMQECGVVSPDAVDNAGRKSTDSPTWNPAGSCATGLADAVAHTTPLANAVYSWCTDINADRAVTLGDATTLTPYLANAVSCAGNAGN